jgi:hypothetical protein
MAPAGLSIYIEIDIIEFDIMQAGGDVGTMPATLAQAVMR